MKTLSIIACLLLAPALAAAGEPAKPAPPQRASFTKKPTAMRNGDPSTGSGQGKVTISFAVSAPTDVAVFIEDSKGEVVRHLVAGVLGQNPPAPLKPGLAQSIEWDGMADYGKPAGNGPFKVRVALGLGAKYDRVVSSNPVNFEWIAGLGTAPDGTLYVRNLSSPAVFNHTQLVALDRDGKYLRTLFPFPANLKTDQVAAYGVMELDGRPAPYCAPGERDLGISDAISGNHNPRFASMTASPDGKELYMLLGNDKPYSEPGIVRLGSDGSVPAAPFCEPMAPGGGLGIHSKSHGSVAISSDGRSLFVAGLSSDQRGAKPLCAVYRVPIPERKGAKVFYGATGPGKGKGQLGGVPSGLATDGKGSLLIADPANGRIVVVDEKSGEPRGEIKADALEGLGASHRTGAVYALGKQSLLKFDSAQSEKPSAELPMKASFERLMVVDPMAEPPLVWVGDRVGVLTRIEDKGGKLEGQTVGAGSKAGSQEGYVGLVVDRLRKEIYARNGGNGSLWIRFNEKTGQLENVNIPDGVGGGGHGLQLTPAPDGNLYGVKWPYRFYKFGRDGKPLAWAKPKRPVPDDMMDPTKEMAFKPKVAPHIGIVPVAMIELPAVLGMRWSDGHFLIQEAGVCVPGGGPKTMKALHEYGLDGQRLTKMDAPIIWKMSERAVGPKLDAAGNIYIAETVRPKGWIYPDKLRAALDKVAPKNRAEVDSGLGNTYGSIVKFTPKGGMFHYETGRGGLRGPDPFRGAPKLDGLKVVEYDSYARGLVPLKVTGAEWVSPGIGHVGNWPGCNCENVTFDVDEFGRCFYPDMALFRVGMIDTAGNLIGHFGGYGNPESPSATLRAASEKTSSGMGPESQEKSLSQPDIAFAYLTGVGVTDRYAYMGDAMNRRLLRAKLVYAAEESCEIK